MNRLNEAIRLKRDAATGCSPQCHPCRKRPTPARRLKRRRASSRCSIAPLAASAGERGRRPHRGGTQRESRPRAELRTADNLHRPESEPTSEGQRKSAIAATTQNIPRLKGEGRALAHCSPAPEVPMPPSAHDVEAAKSKSPD